MEEQLKIPDFVKYRRIRKHIPDDPKRKLISKHIGNCMMGENSVMGAKVVIITEGAPDWVSAIAHGFNAISPVTTNFKEEHFDKLEQFTAAAESIYIINDNEDNQAGLQGAKRTAKHLSKTGKNVYIVTLPMPDGKDKIDLNEYFLDNTADDLRKLMSEAEPFLEWLIKQLPKNLPKALPEFRADILPIIAAIEDKTLQYYYISLIVTHMPAFKEKAIKEEIQGYKKQLKDKESQKPDKPVDPEILKEVEKLQQDKQLVKKRIDLMHYDGVVGERNVVATYFAALDSRLLEEPMAVKNSGHWGAGKSYTLDKARAIYPEEAYVFITSGSPKSLYHLEQGMKHKALIIAEAFQFQSGNKKDYEIAYAVRTLISEKCIRYWVTEKDDVEGKLKTVEKVLDGPTAFITTTIVDTVEKQMEDRLHTVHPDESPEQTNRVIKMIAKRKSGSGYSLDKKTVLTWKTLHRSLQPVNLIIPFAEEIADFLIKSGKNPIMARRAFSKVFSVVESIACVYQFQREKDDKGRIIAIMADYHMGLQMFEESFKENLGQQSKKVEDRLVYVEENGLVQLNDMVDAWKISKPSVSTWVRAQVKEGTIEWCDEFGKIIDDERELKKLKSSGKAYVISNDTYKPTLVTGLPTAFQLTKDPTWQEDGVLYKLYDLQLKEQKPAIKKVENAPVKEDPDKDIKEKKQQNPPITDIWGEIGDIDMRKTS